MGSVDKSDQMVQVNSSAHKMLKWIKKLFFYTMDLSVTNAYIPYCKQVEKDVGVITSTFEGYESE